MSIKTLKYDFLHAKNLNWIRLSIRFERSTLLYKHFLITFIKHLILSRKRRRIGTILELLQFFFVLTYTHIKQHQIYASIPRLCSIVSTLTVTLGLVIFMNQSWEFLILMLYCKTFVLFLSCCVACD